MTYIDKALRKKLLCKPAPIIDISLIWNEKAYCL